VTSPDDGTYDGPLVNDPPVPVLTGPKKAVIGQKVKFSGASSSDSDGTVEEYKFDFGDGTDSGWQKESKAKHSYEEKGTYNVKVYVKDDLGGESVSTEMVVTVEESSSFEIPTNMLLGAVGLIIVIVIVIVVVIAMKKRKKVKDDKDKAEMDKFFVRPGATERAPRREARMGEAGYVGAPAATGAVHQAEETQVNNCPKCGDLLEADLDYCPTCGHVLKKEKVQEKPPPKPRPAEKPGPPKP
jgi:PKD repeat protein